MDKDKIKFEISNIHKCLDKQREFFESILTAHRNELIRLNSKIESLSYWVDCTQKDIRKYVCKPVSSKKTEANSDRATTLFNSVCKNAIEVRYESGKFTFVITLDGIENAINDMAVKGEMNNEQRDTF